MSRNPGAILVGANAELAMAFMVFTACEPDRSHPHRKFDAMDASVGYVGFRSTRPSETSVETCSMGP